MSQKNCTICHDDIPMGKEYRPADCETVDFNCKCNYYYHTKCFFNHVLLRKTCPTCRDKLTVPQFKDLSTKFLDDIIEKAVLKVNHTSQ